MENTNWRVTAMLWTVAGFTVYLCYLRLSGKW